MNYFEKATEVLGKYAETAGDITNRAKIKFALANLQDDLDTVYEKLGAIRYDSIKNGRDHSSRETAAVAKIDRIKADMEMLKAELEVSKNICPSCGAKTVKGSGFCPSCGEKL